MTRPTDKGHLKGPHKSFDGAITIKGAQMFNKYYTSDTRKIKFLGIKLGYVTDEDAANWTDRDWLTLRNYDGMHGTVIPGANSPNAYIPIETPRVVEYRTGENNPYGNIIKIPVLLSKEIIGGSDVPDRFHELGVFAQVMQAEPPVWQNNITYRKNDYVTLSTSTPATVLYKSKVDGNISKNPENSPNEWERLTIYPTITLGNHPSQWYPVPGEDGDPFLFYIVAKYRYPLCIDYGFTLRYDLNIELFTASPIRVFCGMFEETIALPEIQMAYLETLSAALRDARDQQRIGQVAINRLGQWSATTTYNRGDVVSKDNKLWVAISDGLIGENLTREYYTENLFPTSPMWVNLTPGGHVSSSNIALNDPYGWLELSREIVSLAPTWRAEDYPIGDHDSGTRHHVVVHNNKLYACIAWQQNHYGSAWEEPGTPNSGSMWREIHIRTIHL